MSITSLACVIFGIWCQPAMQVPPYDDHARIVFPVEAFGANWRVKFFRKNIPFPDNINNAFDRAQYAANDYSERTGLPVTITFAPRFYTLKRSLRITEQTKNLTVQGANIRVIDDLTGFQIGSP